MIPESLVNMAVTDEEEGAPVEGVAIVAGEGEPAETMGEGAEYPWGLTLSLTQDDMGKLGLDAAAMHAGQEINIQAMARVKAVVETEQEGEEMPSGMLELQITDMSVDADMGFDDAWDEAVEADMATETGMEGEGLV